MFNLHLIRMTYPNGTVLYLQSGDPPKYYPGHWYHGEEGEWEPGTPPFFTTKRSNALGVSESELRRYLNWLGPLCPNRILLAESFDPLNPAPEEESMSYPRYSIKPVGDQFEVVEEKQVVVTTTVGTFQTKEDASNFADMKRDPSGWAEFVREQDRKASRHP